MPMIPRLVVAAPHSGAGKTTVTAGLIAALRARTLRVAPFKAGPDYIDPGYHALAAGRACHNLDTWMLSPDQVVESFLRRAAAADIAVVEGVMGLFDGASGRDDTGSAAFLARLLDAPVLLVLDARAMARTAAALVKGLAEFDPRVRVAGVVANQVGSEGHARLLREAIEGETGLPLLGYLPRREAFVLPERHLGLIPTLESRPEGAPWQEWIAAVRDQVEATVDVAAIAELARQAPSLPSRPAAPIPRSAQGHAARPRIAVARDAAFSFLYEDNLDLLAEAGAELCVFSPLQDRALPADTRALYLCGGFPELYADRLAANATLLAQIRAAAADGMPIYAECGGLMVLSQALETGDGACYPMAGVLPGRSRMTERLTFGYRIVRAYADSWLWQPGETIRGHEFHYSAWEPDGDGQGAVAPLYEILPRAGDQPPTPAGLCTGNVLASYIHLHFLAMPVLAARFVAAAQHWPGALADR